MLMGSTYYNSCQHSALVILVKTKENVLKQTKPMLMKTHCKNTECVKHAESICKIQDSHSRDLKDQWSPRCNGGEGRY
jgi:hypothetical protein